MISKNTILSTKKYILFFLPFIIMVFYFFLYPLAFSASKSLLEAHHLKKEASGVDATKYKKINQDIFDTFNEKREQCFEQCEKAHLKDESASYYKEKCIECIKNLSVIKGKKNDAIVYDWREKELLEIQKTSFSKLFWDFFKKTLTSSYKKVMAQFNFQNILVALLVLILYYNIIFGIAILQKNKKYSKN